MTSEPTGSGVRRVKSAEHTVLVLEFLASRRGQSVRIREVAEATGIPRSSAYALLQTLTELGWVQRDQSGVLYGIGIRALIAGVSYLDADPCVQLVRPWLDRLHTALDETVHLARLDGSDVVYLATRESTQYLRVINRVGRRLPASCTSLGKALLAAQPTDQLDRHLIDPLPALTPQTVTDRDVLDEQLAMTRREGYAVEREENTPGLHCIGVALPYGTQPYDAISCSVPMGRMSPERESLIVEQLLAAAAEIGRVGSSLPEVAPR
ncbi:IclR family transcriptional regulator [Microlunatus sp. Y2014]|uniref:IclR family transcriptional regulator n=1 Tax=Microlunatus sp. Y2014 TaxID=3418488 RepID=UPI003DA7691A